MKKNNSSSLRLFSNLSIAFIVGSASTAWSATVINSCGAAVQNQIISPVSGVKPIKMRLPPVIETYTSSQGERVVLKTRPALVPKARLLLLNGIDKDMSYWDPVVNQLGGKNDHLVVEQIDLLGQGASTKLNPKGPIPFERQVAILKEIAEARGWNDMPLMVAGHSYGGGIAARLNRDVPGLVSDVILIAPFVDRLETHTFMVGPILDMTRRTMQWFGLDQIYETSVDASATTGMVAGWVPYSILHQSKNGLTDIINLTRGIRGLDMTGSVQKAGSADYSMLMFTFDEVIPAPAHLALWNQVPEANRVRLSNQLMTHEGILISPTSVRNFLNPLIDRRLNTLP